MVLIAGKGHEDYQEIAGVQASVLRRRPRRRPRSRAAQEAASHDDDDARAGARAAARQSRWSATAATEIERVHSDTRTLQPGDLFVALKGERFDAHDFLAQARSAGAVAR